MSEAAERHAARTTRGEAESENRWGIELLGARTYLMIKLLVI